MTIDNESVRNFDLSCTFCGAGTWAMWEVVTEDGVVFACDFHHVEMSRANIIRLERMRGKEAWEKVTLQKEGFFQEEYFNDQTHINDADNYE
jgi:hypothetical protein